MIIAKQQLVVDYSLLRSARIAIQDIWVPPTRRHLLGTGTTFFRDNWVPYRHNWAPMKFFCVLIYFRYWCVFYFFDELKHSFYAFIAKYFFCKEVIYLFIGRQTIKKIGPSIKKIGPSSIKVTFVIFKVFIKIMFPL